MSRLTEARAALDAYRASVEGQPPSLFDAVEPDPLTPALDSVEANAGPAWNQHALDAVRRAALEHPELTVDDVVPFISEPVHDRRALGAVMRRAAREGLIERVPGQFRNSTRPEAHFKAQALWRSRIREEAAA